MILLCEYIISYFYILTKGYRENITFAISGKTVYQKVAEQPMQQLKFGWTEISGDFHAPNGK